MVGRVGNKLVLKSWVTGKVDPARGQLEMPLRNAQQAAGGV